MIARLTALLFWSALAACADPAHGPARDESHDEAADVERGPHQGRLLRDGPFALEVTIFESETRKEFRLYAFQDGEPVPASAVEASIELRRLGGGLHRFEFQAQRDYLRGEGEVEEPHSFDVTVNARHAGESHAWSYESYEGRTTIEARIAEESGIRTAIAGPAKIEDTVRLTGTVVLNPDRHAHLEARFPGTVRAVRVELGERVRRGQTLLVIEANESMREYPLIAPFAGVVLARNTNVGEVTADRTLIEIADLSEVWVELHAIGDGAMRIAAGQPLRVSSATSRLRADTVVNAVLPLATRGQSIVIRARLPNASGHWRPGMTVSADVVLSQRAVPLAVRESALQRFRDFDVVFAQVGETYEVRMLDLGARDGEFAEVLDGLEPGTEYVAEQSFLIKADIEKSGAAHDH